MSISDGINIGLVFHSFVTLVVAVVAFILIYEIFSRPLSREMRAYGLFWGATGLLWLQNAIRNAAMGLGVVEFPRVLSAILSQSTVFLSGIPLFYYVGMHVFKNKRIAVFLMLQSVVAGIIGIYFLALPGGIILEPLTFFTAEAIANPISALIFRVEIGSIVLILIYKLFQTGKLWWNIQKTDLIYEIFYDITIILYVTLGVVDLAKVVSDWGLVLFRLLYSAVFLTVYLIIRRERSETEEYLVEKREGLIE